jgi:2'-5' RNA ligase
VALAVCLLFDAAADRALRSLWTRLEDAGVPTLLTHTHRHHVPHLSYAVLRTYELDAARSAVSALPDSGPLTLHADALGLFRRGRASLVPSVTSELAGRQERVVEAAVGTGADLHRNYRPGAWVPHVSLATRARLGDLPAVAALAYTVLPMRLHVNRAALVDSSTGEQWPLAVIP